MAAFMPQAYKLCRTLVGVSLVVTVMLPLVVLLVIVHVMDGRSRPARMPAANEDTPLQVNDRLSCEERQSARKDTRERERERERER